MDKNAKILVIGARGMVGSAIIRRLEQLGYRNVVGWTRKNANLLDRAHTVGGLMFESPQYVFLAAAKVGGIIGNRDHPADFGYENITIQSNVMDACHQLAQNRSKDFKKFLFLGSSCIYPKNCPQPIKESYLLSDKLEPTNEMYALAKIFGVKMCEAYRKQYGHDFISAMPCNLYGPNDTFDEKNGHVIPALLRRFHKARVQGASEVTCWGSGKPRREFLHVEDCADACIFLMNNYSGDETVNVGTGSDITIEELCLTVKRVVGFEGKLVWDTDKPDGTMKKCLDTTKINEMGWMPSVEFEQGLQDAYNWYLKNAPR